MTFNAENPFAHRSTLPFELPPFERIKIEHYLPAFYAGCEEHLTEIEAIISEPEVSFENTVVAMEKAGALLGRMLFVFYNKSSSDTSDELDAIEAEIAPKLAAHQDAITLNPKLFSRVDALFADKDLLMLDPESAWLLERYHRDFVHAGAHLTADEREVLKVYNERLSVLQTQFDQKQHTDVNDLAIVVQSLEELDGLSESQIATLSAAAESRGLLGQWVIPMVNFSGHPLLASLTNRSLRERIMKNALSKGGRANANDVTEIVKEVVGLRAQKAKLMGFKNHAEYVISDQTAQNPENVHAMLQRIAPAAVRNARLEASDIQAAIDDEHGGFEVASWDWDLYTERVRLAKYNVDTEKFKPYFELERVLQDGIFFAATKLFGITFSERRDLVAYHKDARVFEVHDEDGAELALFVFDAYARESKRGGAWMNNLVDQSHLLGQKPVVVNNLNIPKPPSGEPTLLTFDETNTLFHEFGHALHGMLSNVNYPRFSGTSTPRDFVEFPSQVNEMWMLWPEVVSNYARHYQTGEPLPQEWIDNLKATDTFNQGHATTSYLAASILDLAWHELEADFEVTDVFDFETRAIEAYGLDFAPVPTRYRTTYFSHIFAGGYSAGYYGYIWSEVLDAETVEWFKDNGGLTRANGDHFRSELLSRGGCVDAMQLFRNFRGQDASIEPLLKRRGLN
jgi:peptidyl-dipeptidase Dcp